MQQIRCACCGVHISGQVIKYTHNDGRYVAYLHSEHCKEEWMRRLSPTPLTRIADVFACTSTEEFKNMLDKLIEEKMNA